MNTAFSLLRAHLRYTGLIMLSLVVRPNFLVEVSQSDTPACSPAHMKIPNMCYTDWGPDEVREKLKRGCVSLLHSRRATALLNDSADL